MRPLVPNWSVVLGLGATLILAMTGGCTVCASPYDFTYAAYGGKWDRHDRVRGRVGSAFYNPGPPVPTAAVPQTPDVDLQAQPDALDDDGPEPPSALDPEPLEPLPAVPGSEGPLQETLHPLPAPSEPAPSEPAPSEPAPLAEPAREGAPASDDFWKAAR